MPALTKQLLCKKYITECMFILGFFAHSSYGQTEADRFAELEEKLASSIVLIESLAEKVEYLEFRLAQQLPEPAPAVQDPTAPPSNDDLIEVAQISATGSEDIVDLSISENTYFESSTTAHVLSNPWWQNFTLSGFATAGYYDTGSAGTRDNGGSEVKDASLFIEADIWENTSFFLELQTNPLGRSDRLETRTGEAYIHARDIAVADDYYIGVKLGRIDVPFGEEYLKQDSIDNPLITSSAANPYGLDEGLLLYSSDNPIKWIFAITDGTWPFDLEENTEKAYALKIYGNPLQSLYLSASYLDNGGTAWSALGLGGAYLRPVGDRFVSTLGTSPSTSVSGKFAELDFKYDFQIDSMSGYIEVALGGAQQKDEFSEFDRDLRWLRIEPILNITNNWYAVLRYSEIGTGDNDLGYQLNGRIFANGIGDFGYDSKGLRRLGLGLGWTPNPNLRAKIEIGKDWFELIDQSVFESNNSNRNFIGFELATKF